MNRDDMIRMAREADLVTTVNGRPWIEAHEPGQELEMFSHRMIIEAVGQYFKNIDLAVQIEREACSQIAKDWDKDHPDTNYGVCIAEAIKARSNA